MTDSRAEDLIKIGQSLFSKATPWNMMAQDICEQFYPARANYTAYADLSTDYASYIMDGSPITYLETLANTIPAMLRQGDWFEVGSGDENRDRQPEAKRALAYVTDRMRGVVRGKFSNFANATKEGDHDYCSVGQAVLSLQESRDRTHFEYHAHHPKDCAWLTDPLGNCAAMWREGRLSARNMVAKVDSGRWNGTVSREVREAARIDPSREFRLYHVLMPTGELYATDHRSQVRVGHKFVSCYIDIENRTYLHEGGLPVFNYITPSFRRLSGQTRGYSPPTFNCIGDAKMLQSLALIILEQGEKAVDPPLVASGEIFTGGDINLYAGGTTFVDLGERKLNDVMTTIETSDSLRLGVELKQDVRMLIAESLLLNKLTLPSVREMRELEVMVRTEEFRRAALPFFSPIEVEYHEKLLALTFDMMMVRGMFPPDLFPPELQGSDVAFTFQSPLNEVEGRKTVEAFLTTIQLAQAAAEIDPETSNLINMRDALVDAIDGAGAGAQWVKSEREREAADQKAEQMQEMRQGADVAQRAAGVVADLSNARVALANAAAAA